MRLRNGAGTVVSVSDATAARLLSRGWTPADRPAAVPPEPAPPVEERPVDLPSTKDELIAVAEAEGITVDRRWGAERLTAAILTARGDR